MESGCEENEPYQRCDKNYSRELQEHITASRTSRLRRGLVWIGAVRHNASLAGERVYVTSGERRQGKSRQSVFVRPLFFVSNPNRIAAFSPGVASLRANPGIIERSKSPFGSTLKGLHLTHARIQPLQY